MGLWTCHIAGSLHVLAISSTDSESSFEVEEDNDDTATINKSPHQEHSNKNIINSNISKQKLKSSTTPTSTTQPKQQQQRYHSWIAWMCIVLMCGLFLFADIIHPIAFRKQHNNSDSNEVDTHYLPFLPLLLTSIVCALPLILCWFISGYTLLLQLWL